jgi:hypothetical protein
MRWILVLLHLVAAAVALVFLVLAALYIAVAAAALCTNQVAGTVILLVPGGGLGWLAIRVLLGLRASFNRRHRRWMVERALPRARIVQR